LIDLLASAEKVWIQTHFNHPREITPEAARVCKALLRAGMPVNNQSVLLRGVNDSVETMRKLMRALLRIKVRPYYIFHCDPVIGAGHFRTSVWKGLEIIEGLRGHMSGLGIPTYVVDSPHGGGKIPMMPNYLVSMADDAVVLRNYEGQLIRYQAEDKPNTAEQSPTRGVSALLQGSKTVLVPEDNERMARRRARQEAEAAPSVNGTNGVHHGNGCCGGGGADHHNEAHNHLNGHGGNGVNGHGHVNGNGVNGHGHTNGHRKELVVLSTNGESQHG
jgi:lysine 2,3-aminomutase